MEPMVRAKRRDYSLLYGMVHQADNILNSFDLTTTQLKTLHRKNAI